MFDSWKNRFWQLVLVCTFAVVLSVCNKAMDSSSGGSSSSGTAFADGSTVTISSAPIPKISHYIICDHYGSAGSNNGVYYFYSCDATDSTSLQTIEFKYSGNSSSTSNKYAISLEDLHNAGFQPCISSEGNHVFCK